MAWVRKAGPNLRRADQTYGLLRRLEAKEGKPHPDKRSPAQRALRTAQRFEGGPEVARAEDRVKSVRDMQNLSARGSQPRSYRRRFAATDEYPGQRLDDAVFQRSNLVPQSNPFSKAERAQPTPEQIAASKARREAQQAQAAAAKEKVANTPKGGIWTGKPVSQTWRNHLHRGSIKNAAISTGLATTATGGVLLSQRRKVEKRDTRRDLETAGGAVAGAATMDALNTVGGQSAKAILKERRNRRGFSPNEEKRWAEHKKTVLGTAAGQPVPNDDSVPQHKKAQLYRTAPKGSIPDRTANRLLAFKNTKGWTGGSLAGAAGVGALAAHRRGSVEKMDPTDLPRAARRAAPKRTKPTEEEIAALRAAKGRTGAPKPPDTPPPAPEAAAAPVAPAARARSSFLGRGQIRDLAIGVPVGAAGLGYALRPQRKKPEALAKADRRRERAGALGLGAGAVAAHAAEGRELKLSERELGRVISANNADGVGVGDFKPEQPRIDRGIHASRAVSRLDNARALRGAKSVLGLGTLVAGKKAVEKRDRGDTAQRTAAGAVGGAALLDAADTVAGASLKRIAVRQRDEARRTMTSDQVRANNTIMREHGEKHGLVDDRGRGRAPKPDDPHKTKNAYYRSYPTAVPGGRVQRLNALRDKKTGPILAAGATLGGLAGLHSSRVEKAGKIGFHHVGALTGTGAAASVLTARRHGATEEAKEAAGATLGGWAAQGAYQGAGYGARNAARGIGGSKVPRHELPHLKADEANFPDPAERAKRAQNAKEREQLNRHHPRKVDQKRNTPLHWHGAKTERILGRTHGGKTGTALGTALTLGGVALGAEAASSKKRPLSSSKVTKAVTYGYMEERRNKQRTAYQVGGAALAAGGAAHLQVGRAVARGQRYADASGRGKQYRQGADVVRRGRNQVRNVSGQAVTGLRSRVPGFGTALSVIPPKLRPHAAIGGGALLAARGTPAHDERFVPTGRW